MNEFCNKVFNGDVRASARLMRLVDDRAEGYEEYMKEVWKHTGRAHIIGITGAPGAGKSTMTDKLIAKYRSMGKTVGVVAIDPTTRGHLGGLSVSTMDIVAVMDAMGKDVVIIETVGVGQDEVEIAMVADTCIVVTVPGLGDDIQAIKAGIFEIADIFIVNKADREGVERTVKDLEMMLEMVHQRTGWDVQVLKTVAARDEGIDNVVEAISNHAEFFDKNVKASRGVVREKIVKEIFKEDEIRALLKSGLDPYTAVEKLWEKRK